MSYPFCQLAENLGHQVKYSDMVQVTTVEQMDRVLVEAAEVATARLRLAGIDRLTYGDPTSNEEELFKIIQEICRRDFTPDSVEHVGGHKFPDIVFPFAGAGVEVKCHRRAGEALLGNSIMGSTFSIDEPQAVRLLVWTASTSTVTFHDYFESVVGAEVTHSPRFRLRPGAPPEERLFGVGAQHVGPAHEVCLGPDGIDSERIIARMRADALAQGSFPWWIGQEKSMSPVSNFSILRFSSLTADQRSSLETLSTFIFPEVLGRGSQTKYHEVIAWGVSTRSVLLSRDLFSASGRKEILIDAICLKHDFTIPRSFFNGIERLSREVDVSLEELKVCWNLPQLKSSGVYSHFSSLLNEVDISQVVSAVQSGSCAACAQDAIQVEAALRKLVLDAVNLKVVE